mgnify:CR=1 FL=1
MGSGYSMRCVDDSAHEPVPDIFCTFFCWSWPSAWRRSNIYRLPRLCSGARPRIQPWSCPRPARQSPAARCRPYAVEPARRGNRGKARNTYALSSGEQTSARRTVDIFPQLGADRNALSRIRLLCPSICIVYHNGAMARQRLPSPRLRQQFFRGRGR